MREPERIGWGDSCIEVYDALNLEDVVSARRQENVCVQVISFHRMPQSWFTYLRFSWIDCVASACNPTKKKNAQVQWRLPGSPETFLICA